MPSTKETIQEIKTNENGQKVKIIKKVVLIPKGVAERKKWIKFGECKGFPPGPDSNSTSVGDDVFLRLSSNQKDLDNEGQEDDPLKKAIASGAAKIVCRICKGDHWTTKCPFKDTYQPINEIKASSDSNAAAASSSEATPAASGGKYVPPSRRAGATASSASASGPGSSGRDQDQSNTIRIFNLSEDVQDQDVRDLVSRFGPVQRVFVAKNRDTGLCKGFAFVTFYDKQTCQAAIDKLDGFGYDSLILRVDWAKRD